MSWVAPVARLCSKARVGDEVAGLPTPLGRASVEVVEVRSRSLAEARSAAHHCWGMAHCTPRLGAAQIAQRGFQMLEVAHGNAEARIYGVHGRLFVHVPWVMSASNVPDWRQCASTLCRCVP